MEVSRLHLPLRLPLLCFLRALICTVAFLHVAPCMAIMQLVDTVEVKVTGMGASPQEAYDDALREAIREVIGVIVKSSSVVVDDQLASAVVESKSQDFVERSEKLGVAVPKDGVFEQRARVVVRKSELERALQKAPGSGKPGNGRTAKPTVQVDPSEIVEVEVVGQGRTPEEALEDAARAALRAVAKTLVRADSMASDDQLLQDRVLTHSGGFIQKIERSGNARLKNGMYEQSAVVQVRRGKVAQALAGEASPSGQFDALTLYARIQSMREQRASAHEFVKVLFEDFPACVLRYEVSEAPHEASPPEYAASGDVTVGASEVYLEVKIDAMIDREKWAEWCKSAAQVFEAVSDAKGTVNWSARRVAQPRLPVEEGPAWGTSDQFIRDLGPSISKKTGEAAHLFGLWAVDTLQKAAEVSLKDATAAKPKGTLKAPLDAERGGVVVALNAADGAKTEVYRINRALLIPLEVEVSEAPSISVELIGSDGGVVGAREVARSRRGESGAGSLALYLEGASWMAATPLRVIPLYNMIVLCPWMNTEVGQAPIFSERASLPFGFVVDRADVPKLGKVRVEFGRRAKCEFISDVPQRLPKN
ncbi:MAG: hypothetical protein RIT24_2854 [Planctomycetota bacterium]|jgi:hypothetical protein